MLSICKPRVLRAAGPCCSSSAGARRPRCCAVLSAAAGDRSGCYRPHSSSSSVARAGAAAAGRVGSLRLACVARAVGPKDEEPAAPEAQAAARAAQQQQAARARVQSFNAAAKRVFSLQTLREPPREPPPLSALPAEPLPADSIPPLLEWVTTARMRPVAVQSILEQHCSPGVRRIVAAAARLAEAEQEEQSRKGKGGGGGILITSAHLALAALAEHDGDVDCAAALGVLHHSQAGLSRRRCAEVLAERAAQERRWREEETRQYEDSGSSSGTSIFSAPALHFVFQSYRWAVFKGEWCGSAPVHGCRLPCLPNHRANPPSLNDLASALMPSPCLCPPCPEQAATRSSPATCCGRWRQTPGSATAPSAPTRWMGVWRRRRCGSRRWCGCCSSAPRRCPARRRCTSRWEGVR